MVPKVPKIVPPSKSQSVTDIHQDRGQKLNRAAASLDSPFTPGSETDKTAEFQKKTSNGSLDSLKSQKSQKSQKAPD